LPAVKPPKSVPQNQVVALAVLHLLTLLTIILWFQDPAHRYSGNSRVSWPPASPAKP
jgi:hypothetical protein